MKFQTAEMRRIVLYLGIYIAVFNLRVTADENTEICMEAKDPGEITDPKLRNIEWFYSKDEDKCHPFVYNGVGGNRNRFSNETQCLKTCSPKYHQLFPDGAAACQLQKERGDCRAMILRWYYDVETGDCDTFFFSGCHGNGNRFENKLDCRNLCAPIGQGRRSLEEEIANQQRDEGDTVTIVLGCLFGVAVIAFVAVFVIQRKKHKSQTRKSKSTEVEMQ
ncbi:BPTI/Kunitz domain-containing protein 5 [Pristis pectinata]|uniref:BPTI/Kunitz domain-containing protein 5 n=1 Tax=Pristis pectinata TaxID=685728 RepID=UPI00223D91A2|nr:BPTI/Kunitz domain-containing protein 5 [Pristis pectinata]